MNSEFNTIQFILAMQHAQGFSLHEINRLLTHDYHNEIQSFADANDYLTQNTNTEHRLSNEDWQYGSDAIEKSIGSGVQIIPITSAPYPFLLRFIPNPPPAIHIRGNLHVFDSHKFVSVVGTRKASSSGLTIAQRISKFFANENWTVVSGLALGIDAAAHKGCLESGGTTVAILAHGLHKASPKTNEALAHLILENGGAWVSEHPFGVEAKREYFVERNRIQVGISAGSVIVECDERSGTVTQAQYGIGQQRAIFAVLPDMRNSNMNLNISGAKALIEFHNVIRIASKKQYPSVLNSLTEKLTEFENRA